MVVLTLRPSTQYIAPAGTVDPLLGAMECALALEPDFARHRGGTAFIMGPSQAYRPYEIQDTSVRGAYSLVASKTC